MRKELMVSLVNGLTWGAVTGAGLRPLPRAALGAVMMTAVLLNLIVAAVTGIAVPLMLHRARGIPHRARASCSRSSPTAWGFSCFSGWRSCCCDSL